MKKAQIFYIVFILTTLVYFSCNNAKKSTKLDRLETEKLWRQNCTLCHGSDGRLGLNGAKDLRLSELSLAPRIEIIKKGKGKMIGFENSLNKNEIEALAKYTFNFK